jgi:polysaccharide biosynthesis transport protein
MKILKNLEPLDYLKILWMRRWYCLIFFVLTASGVSLYAWKTPEIFKSETKVIVESPYVSEEYVHPIVRSSPEDRIDSIRQQLASRSFLERIIEQFQMYGYGTPKFAWEKAIGAAQKQIGIEKTSSNTFTISFLASEPSFAQTVTRQLAQELIRTSTSSKKKRVDDTYQFIDEQLRQSADALAVQEDRLKKFKFQHLGELPEQSPANISALSGLYSQLSAVENAIQQALERQKLIDFRVQERKRLNLLSLKLTAAQSAAQTAAIKTGNGNRVKTPSPAEIELAAQNVLLADYMNRYTSNHPDVIKLRNKIAHLEQQVQTQKANAEREITPVDDSPPEMGNKEKPVDVEDVMDASFQFEADGVKSELAKREKEKKEILQSIKVYQNRLNLMPVLEQELAGILRDYNNAKAQFENFEKQKFNSQLAKTAEDDKRSETYRVYDDAYLPTKPELPNRLQLMLIGICGGLAVGFGAAFGRELLDTTIGSEEEAKKLLNLPVLVTISLVPKEKKGKKAKNAA